MDTKRHTYDMGIIGNCNFLSYIAKDTNIAWQCWPRFDSSFIFGGILDEDKGGHFQVLPTHGIEKSEQYYIENTNVLCTEITSSDGRYKVTDFAPRFYQYDRYFKPLMVIRKVQKLEGNPSVIVRCSPRGEYGEAEPEVSLGSNHIRYRKLEDQVRLTTNVPLSYVVEERPTVLNDTVYLILTWGVPLEAPLEDTAETFLKKTIQYWRGWIEHCTIPKLYQKQVIRSSLILKLHQFEDTGAIIASGTTSLPESPGSTRNWDYRFFWVRDTYYTLNAFSQIGHFEELDSYSHFLQNIVANYPTMAQPVYSILGHTELIEKQIDLAGYQGNQPVRIGNLAYQQVQNDVYGQILLSLLPLYIDERIISRRRTTDRRLIDFLLDQIANTMDSPDSGLWEFRGMQQKHCYTFLFHWAGANAAKKIGAYFCDDELQIKASKLAQAAAKQIEACYNPELKCYTSAVGGKDLDSSLFQLIAMHYLDPHSQRAADHLEALRDGLQANGKGLFYRYVHADDFGTPEVAFLVCGFWYVSALTALNRVDEATEAFESLLKCGNHLGLLSEDVSVGNLSQWGNFVQTYSHVGLINCAFEIDRKIDRPLFL